MNTKTLLTALATTAALAASSASAATISWTVSTITDSSDVSTNGDLVIANSGASTDVTVNGVTFAAGFLFDTDGVRFSTTAGSGSLPTPNAAEAAYNTLLDGINNAGDGALIDGGPATNDFAVVEFTALTIGQAYEIQFWASRVTSNPGNKRAVALSDGVSTTAPVANTDTTVFVKDPTKGASDAATGQFATGTFTADATTQSFLVREWDNLNTTPAGRVSSHLGNGLQLRAVPEPSSLALLGLGGLLINARRRRG